MIFLYCITEENPVLHSENRLTKVLGAKMFFFILSFFDWHCRAFLKKNSPVVLCLGKKISLLAPGQQLFLLTCSLKAKPQTSLMQSQRASQISDLFLALPYLRTCCLAHILFSSGSPYRKGTQHLLPTAPVILSLISESTGSTKVTTTCE